LNEKLTYKDKGKTKWHFISTIDVVCPKCKKKATLKTPNQNQVELRIQISKKLFARNAIQSLT